MLELPGRLRAALALVVALAALGMTGSLASSRATLDVVVHLELPPRPTLSAGEPRERVVALLRARARSAAAPALRLLEQRGAQVPLRLRYAAWLR